MKIIFGFILAGALLVGGYLLYSIVRPTSGNVVASQEQTNNVSVSEGNQKIELTAKGGYLPKVSTVKAGIPTTLSVNTSGTFDCSSSIRIPGLKISQNLPATGTTDIALGTLTPGVINGNCGMGMYPFQINVIE